MDGWIPWIFALGLVVAFMVFRRLGQVSGARARELVKGGAVLVDVRTPEEFSAGHLDGAINVPLRELSKNPAALLLSSDKPVVLYCASGARSAVARSVLKGRGHTQVHNLGPMSRW